ncbi:MAG: YncE family protein [Planctomycetota bacterium]|jgi:hypothetical protein
MKKLNSLLLTLVLAITCACGEVETLTEDFNDDSSPSESSDENTAQTVAVVHVTDYFSSALISVVSNLESVAEENITPNVVDPLPHTDASLRAFDGLVYVINRLGRDSIQVVDPSDGFETIFEFSIGPATNPYDILVVAENKAYVTLYQPENLTGAEEVLVVNPQNGAVLEKIDLGFLTDNDGDRNPRATMMTRVGDEVWVLIQDLDYTYSADTNGKIAVIDINTDTLVDTDPDAEGDQGIELVGRNPSDLAYDKSSNRVYIAMTGLFQPDFTTDTSDAFGGIEAVDTENYITQGIVLDDAEFGGHPRGIQLASAELAFTIVSDTSVVAFDPSTQEVVDNEVYQSPGFFLPEILIDGDRQLLISERGDFEGQGAGLVILDIQNNFDKQGPLDVGGPPNALTVVDIL